MAGEVRGSAGLLPWTVTEETAVLPAAAAAPPPLPLLSVTERISSPTIFMHQTLVFKAALDAAKLRTALADSLTLFPSLGCRATKDAVRCLWGVAAVAGLAACFACSSGCLRLAAVAA